LAESDGAGVASREHIWLGDWPLAQIEGATLRYVHADHLGQPQKLTSASQTIVWDGRFDSFGATPAIAGSAAQPLRFPGQYADTETGLSQNWHRDYDPALGRYLESDPIGLAGGLNTYSYVGGNPIRFVDPTGLIIDTIWDVANVAYDICTGDWVALAFDVPAMFIPGLPAGITKIGKLPKVKKAWERYYGKEWPKSPEGRNYDAHHKEPKADGGSDHPTNIEPLAPEDHVQHHKSQDDFRRWGKRSRQSPP